MGRGVQCCEPAETGAPRSLMILFRLELGKEMVKVMLFHSFFVLSLQRPTTTNFTPLKLSFPFCPLLTWSYVKCWKERCSQRDLSGVRATMVHELPVTGGPLHKKSFQQEVYVGIFCILWDLSQRFLRGNSECLLKISSMRAKLVF